MIELKPLSPRRQAHSVSVARYGWELAYRLGENPAWAYLAGMLHDRGRELPESELLRLAEQAGWQPSGAELESPLLLHGPVAALIAMENYQVNNRAVLHAIACHTVGGAGLSRLQQIVYLADKIEPTRVYEGVEEVRELALQNFDAALLRAVEDEIRYCRQKGYAIHDNTLAMLAELGGVRNGAAPKGE